MIRSRKEYKEYLCADSFSYFGKPPTLKERLFDEVWAFQRTLRKCEYLLNTNKLPHVYLNLPYVFAKMKLKRLGFKLGFSISENTFEKGLGIAHYGSIVVSPKARIGQNCRIHVGVNIGVDARGEGAPRIGNNVYIAPGAKLFGNIEIGDRTVIGANAVVNKSFPADVTVGGVPARIISNKNSEDILKTLKPE